MSEAASNVVTIEGKEYDEATLADDAKYFIAQIRDLQAKQAQLRFQADQVQAALVAPLLVQLLDVVQVGDALAHIGRQGLEMAHSLQLVPQHLDVHQVFVQQVAVNKVADVGQRAKGQSLDDFGGKGLFELAQAIEQMEPIVFQPRKDLRASAGQGHVLHVAPKGTAVKELPFVLEEPVVADLEAKPTSGGGSMTSSLASLLISLNDSRPNSFFQ